YFSAVVDSFRCEKEAVRLLRLAPGSEIRTHRDIRLAYPFGNFRVHVPVVTGPQIDFIVGGERIEMKEGECWYANFDLPHSVKNHGATERVHLVIDCVRNEWSDELFANAGYDFEAEKKALAPDDETKRRMIEELSRIDTPASRDILEKLLSGLSEK
ncbi:MAG TPA: aspartyl/asparaginyl beta-hydroxylase domain-containing protein, partial [Bacteroidia bacterium]|nr:aspartyl/asparaginyl beta-hydroxylase domain-containing protein [Bacteroidia bacterium]